MVRSSRHSERAPGEVAPAVDEDGVRGRRVHQDGRLGRQYPHLVGEQPERGQHLRRGGERIGEEQQLGHGTSRGQCRCRATSGRPHARPVVFRRSHAAPLRDAREPESTPESPSTRESPSTPESPSTAESES